MDLLPLTLLTEHWPETKVVLGVLPKYLLVDGACSTEITENTRSSLGKLSRGDVENTFFVAMVFVLTKMKLNCSEK